MVEGWWPLFHRLRMSVSAVLCVMQLPQGFDLTRGP